MTATIALIKAGLATRCATAGSTLQTPANWPDQILYPAVIPELDAVDFHESLGDPGHFKAVFSIVVLLAPIQQGYKQGLDALDPYLDPSGTQSLRAAIEGDHTLGGVVDTLIFHGWPIVGRLEEAAGIDYWGAIGKVEVFA